MKHALFLFSCLLLTALLSAQEPALVWAKQMGGRNDDRSESITLDAAGNVYTTGHFQGTVDFEPGPGIFHLTSAGSFDIFVLKLSQPPCTPPTLLNDGSIVLDASCTGNDGNISIIPTSGTAPFQYSINGGATYVEGPATGYSFQSLTAGTYQLRLKDARGCESAVLSKEVHRYYGGPLFKNDGTIVLDASCGANDGNISIIPTCGAAPFMYSIDGGMTYVNGPATGYTFQNLASGTYQLRLKDAYGTESAIVTRQVRQFYGGPTFRNDNSIVKDVSCAASDGTVSIIPITDTGPFQYSINGGETYVEGPSTGYTFMNLQAGTYALRLKDARGCESEVIPRTVNVSEFLPAPYGFVTAPPTCSWGTNGSMIVSLPGKLFPSENTEEEYSIDGGVTYRHSNFFGGLKQGDYFLKARKDNCESPVVPMAIFANIVHSCFPVLPALIAPFDKSASQVGDGLAVVYPNPSKGKFRVQLKKLGSAYVHLQVVDARGAILQQRTLNAEQTSVVDVDLSGKAKGLYLIRVVSDKGTQQTKVLLQ